jgi:co-chaperonin GroES (HSP10)
MMEFEAEDVPQELLPVPCGWRVMIAPVKLREVSEGGIALPQSSVASAEHYRNIAKVLAVGDTAYDDPAFRGGQIVENGDLSLYKPWCKPGDIIHFQCHDGVTLTISHGGKTHKLRFITDRNVVSVIHDTAVIEALL